MNMTQRKSDLYVMTKTKDLAKYILTVTEKSPKKFRFTLVVRIQNYILDTIENIYLANTEKNIDIRYQYQQKAKIFCQCLIILQDLHTSKNVFYLSNMKTYPSK